MKSKSQIREFYSGKSVFITGVSGFLGKALLEKLLRSCPEVNKVYVLIRNKRGKDVNSRLEEILQSPIFDTLKQSQSDCFHKIVAISGDISVSNLGINDNDRNTLVEDVTVVIHSAASIKFNEPIKTALNINYNGTRRILDLCKELKYCSALVHVSTAYSNCDYGKIKEEILVPSASEIYTPEQILCMSDEIAAEITEKVIGKKPNTYTYAKSQAEFLLKQQGSDIPICIIRPSIIVASWKEPEPGFVDSLNGVTGLIAGCGKGVLTSLVCDKTKVADIIPLDIVVNLIIASAWSTATFKSVEIPVYNCCSGSLNPITQKEIQTLGYKAIKKHPFENVFRYPSMRYVTTPALNLMLNFFANFIPFFFLDVLAVLTRQPPKMLKLFGNISTASEATTHFRINEWDFETNNMVKLESKLDQNDKEIFFWNIQDLHWETYFQTFCAGIKKWIFQEDIENLPSAFLHRTRMYWLEICFQFVAITLMGIVILKLI